MRTLQDLFIILIILSSFSWLGALFVTTQKLKNCVNYNSKQRSHIEIPTGHKIRPFRKTGIPCNAATIFTETNDDRKMTVSQEERIVEMDKLTQISGGMMRVNNESKSSSYFTKGDIAIIVLVHALHLSSIAIGFIVGKIIIEQQNKM